MKTTKLEAKLEANKKREKQMSNQVSDAISKVLEPYGAVLVKTQVVLLPAPPPVSVPPAEGK